MNTAIGVNGEEQRVIHISEIYYCEITERKCFAYLETAVYQLDYTLQEFLEKYHDQGMIRISKSMCVNVFKVLQMEADFNMRMKLHLKNDETVLLNRNYKKDFLKYLQQLTGRDE
jgi:DNA-binding LytR/AlgR family response regulator